MVSGEDCSYIDVTESSNITSLQSDTSYTAKANVREPLCKDCKCREIHSAVHHGAPSEQYGVTNTVEESYKKDLPKDQCSMKQTSMPCLCRAHKISAYTLPLKYKNGTSYSRQFWCPFKWKWPKKGYLERKDKTYEVKLTPKTCPHYAEPFMCCEISEGIPNKKKCNTPDPVKILKSEEKKVEITEKIDIYYFDHGNSAYYRTTDSPPILATEKCAEKTDQAATRFWAEIFGTIHIGTAFVTAFILQLVRFILYSIIRPLTVGILQLLADYFIKPLLSIVFNALIQPILILLYNIATSFKDLCEPIAEAIGLFLREIAHLCAAIRIVEVRQGTASSVACT
ncbi:hypothetical protein WN48_02016 [Eufriesea mexicana]|uniref:Uncharacterized protein n=2 Tax=Eufriesea mexicana TaxID=516756 RepID=A0A310SC15_9HYME|nr:hypothetical protein WN48_02016 [Eufriesea mexicana]